MAPDSPTAAPTSSASTTPPAAYEPKAGDDTAAIQDGDTLESIAARETAAGNPLTAGDIARFNWGTVDEAEVQAHLRDDCGARARGEDNRFILRGDDTPRAPLRLPRKLEVTSLDVDRRHTLRLRRRSSPKQLLGSCSLPSITFALQSSFLRPEVVEHLKPIVGLAALHPGGRFLIWGHTDASGDEMFNKRLSERRAWSVHAFITNDADAWEVLYNHPDEHWGVAVLQEVLLDLGHDPGDCDGDLGPNTKDAMRSFLGLPDGASVKNDATFRKALFAAYMASKHDIQLGPDRFVDAGYHGCGEFNPIEVGEDVAETNRRVTIFAFHPERVPAPPCAYNDAAPCKALQLTREHRWQETFSCSYYDSIARECGSEGLTTIRLRLFDALGEPMPGAPARVDLGAYAQHLTADDEAFVEFIFAGPQAHASVAWGALADDQVDAAPEAGDSGPFRYEHDLHLDFDEHADEADATARRLHHLGYRVDLSRPLTEQPGPITSFQLHHVERYGFAITGQLDDATRAAITEVHDTCDPASLAPPEQTAPDGTGPDDASPDDGAV